MKRKSAVPVLSKGKAMLAMYDPMFEEDTGEKAVRCVEPGVFFPGDEWDADKEEFEEVERLVGLNLRVHRNLWWSGSCDKGAHSAWGHLRTCD